MKKFIKILKQVFLLALSAATFVIVLQYYYCGGSSFDGRYYEKTCYAVWCLTSVAVFCPLVDKINSLWKKTTIAVTTSLIYTAAVFFANNLWRYILLNREFEWEFLVPFWTVLKWDITYTYGYGEYRYPMVFLIMLGLCAIKIVLSHHKIITLRQSLFDRFWDWLYLNDLKKQDLTDLYLESIEEPDNSRLVDYVQNMPLTQQGKQNLMCFVDEHRDCFLIYLLFTRYEQLLTSEEYVKYKNLYVEIAEGCIKRRREHYLAAKVEFPDVFGRLEKKFNSTEKG